MTSGIPICAICGRPVEHFEFSRDDDRRLNLYEAKCHGATQRVVLTDMCIQRAGPDGIMMGRAFDDCPVLSTGEDFQPTPPSAFEEFQREMMRAISGCFWHGRPPENEGEPE